MKYAFDIGGVLSKYPVEFRNMVDHLDVLNGIYAITDMHDQGYVMDMLWQNGFFLLEENVHCADYAKYGEMCKAVLLRDLKIDVFIDDFPGYLQWDRSLGKAPLRLLVQPDPFMPYWDETWKTTDDSDFGRRVSPQNL